MKLVPYEKKKLGNYYARTSNLKILEEFLDSGLDCAKLEDYPHKNAYSCSASLRKSIQRFGMKGITIMVRKNDVFLIKN